MQCKYYQILLGQTYEWSLWGGGCFIEVVFKTGSTVTTLMFCFAHTTLYNLGKLDFIANCLKVVSATFWLVCFVCLKESTFDTRKNVFYFTSTVLFVF